MRRSANSWVRSPSCISTTCDRVRRALLAGSYSVTVIRNMVPRPFLNLFRQISQWKRGKLAFFEVLC